VLTSIGVHAHSHRGKRTVGLLADRLRGRHASGWEGHGWGTSHVEESVQSGSNSGQVRLGDTERGSRQRDLVDKVGDLRVRQVHEKMDTRHAGVSLVGGINSVSLHRASEQVTKVLVEMGQEGELVATGSGELVVHERSGTTSVKEAHL